MLDSNAGRGCRHLDDDNGDTDGTLLSLLFEALLFAANSRLSLLLGFSLLLCGSSVCDTMSTHAAYPLHAPFAERRQLPASFGSPADEPCRSWLVPSCLWIIH